MASVQVSFPSDLEGMLRSEIWNYKTDPPHNGAGLSFCSSLTKSETDISKYCASLLKTPGLGIAPFFHPVTVPDDFMPTD